jgi:Holliday junction resolvasome RuvABC endonuclease subunit
MPRGVPRYLVSIDIGRVTGLAHGLFSAVVPACGYWRLPPSDPLDAVGARIAAFDNTLSGAFDEWEPSHVVMAEPIPARNMGESISNFGLHGVVRAECWRRGLPILVQPESTVRKEVLGRGSGPTDLMKSLVMDWCVANGIDATEHNAGDAALLWRWARDEIARQRLAVAR